MELKITSFSQERFANKNFEYLLNSGHISEEEKALMDLGFSLPEISIYSLTLQNYLQYLPDSIRHLITLNSNNGYWPVLHDKLVFYNLVKDYLPTPELLAMVFNGRATFFSSEVNTLSELYSSDLDYVLKPLQGGQGKGIYFIRKDDGKCFLNDDEISLASFLYLVEGLDKYGFFEFVIQHQNLNEVFEKTTNTLRVVTLFDPVKEEHYISSAVLRVGWSGSVPLDNFSHGGLVAKVDLKSGRVDKWQRKDSKGRLATGEYHPDTGKRFSDISIPFWTDVVNQLLSFLRLHPFLDYVGWDVMITPSGFTIIEGNHNPDLDLIQIFGGYLADVRNVNYFKKIGVV